MQNRLELLGVPGSPYTRKMLALLRYRRIPYSVIWGNHRNPPSGYPAPKVKLLPTVYFRDEAGRIEAVVDSTPIIKRLETETDQRSVVPNTPELAFYCNLIEDYADEWLTKPMFHYRWYHEADRNNAGPMLTFWGDNTAPADMAQQFSDMITKIQFDRLYVVGSNEITAQTIEDSYKRFLSVLNNLIQIKGYVLGARPSAADFAIYAQLTQLGQVEPTPSAIMAQSFPRVRAWIDLMEDLSGLEPSDEGWFSVEEAREALAPLIDEIAHVYLPFLVANAEAAMQNKDTVEAEIDGRTWTQPTFPYQVKCLDALRTEFQALPNTVRNEIGQPFASLI